MQRLIWVMVCLVLCAGVTHAAVSVNSFVTPQTPNRGIVQFLQGTDVAGTYKTLYTAGGNGSKCTAMTITTNDATAHVMTIQLVNATVKYGGLTITTGTSLPGFANGVGPIAVMTATNWPGLPQDSDGNLYITLNSGDTIQATFATALTSTDVINMYVSCADF